MRTSFRSRPLPHPARSGFSLLELMAVVAVIAVLLALLLPALMGARGKARVVQVKTEIAGLTKAIQDFKVKYGIEPPSMITLYETGSSWQSGNPASAAIISRIWPQFAYGDHDFNLDGSIGGSYTLHGAECLVFFLGGPTIYVDANSDGLYTSGETVQPVNGFSRNPADPFAPLPAAGTSNRDGPYYTFLPDRLVTGQQNSSSVAFTFGYSDSMPGTPVPYLYVNSNEGQGYNVADFGTLTHPSGINPNYVYLNGTTNTSPAWNPTGFQIISAGLDRLYGGPGASFAGPYQKGADMGVNRDNERDNITNFSEGVLAQ